MKSTKGFTLVELLVVIGLLAMLMAAMTVSISGAQKRAQIAKAESEVKVIEQAILAYEQYDSKHELPTMTEQEASESTLKDLIGNGKAAKSGGQIPALLMAQLSEDGVMKDPWQTPYRITVKKGSASMRFTTAAGNLQSGFYFPNYYRLSKEERQ